MKKLLLISNLLVLAISIIEFVGNTLFALSLYSDHILKSDNYGKTWELEKIQNIANYFYSPAQKQYYKIDSNRFLIPVLNNHLYSVKVENYENIDSTIVPNENIDTLITTDIQKSVNEESVQIRQFGNQYELVSTSSFIGNQIIEIYNQKGIIEKSFEFVKSNQNEVHRFKINLPVGVYFVMIKEGETIVTKKILKFE